MMKFIRVLVALVFVTNIAAQTLPNDCANALTVCGNGTFYSNASGIGDTQEINFCGGYETNSLWLKVTIVQAGTLGFDLIPDDPSVTVDYDFWVFGPNAICGALGAPVRCATTNPQQAGMTNNLTGMNGTTLLTQTGPGSNGNGYVRWLNVLPGQTYYIAINRPAGDGGFQIQWTGTAMSGTGAFTTPPPANAIGDVKTCSNTPNVGIFDLNAISPLINPNTTDNTVTYYETLASAIDNIEPLPFIYANISNPQLIYVRVTDNVSGCYSTTEVNLVVNLVPTISMSIANPTFCLGQNANISFTGTPNATFDYTINSGATQTAVLSATGTYTLTDTPTVDTTYTLTGVRALDATGNTICYQPLNQSLTVTVAPLPTATIAGTTTICSGSTAVITFTGTANAAVTYTVDGGTNQTIVLDALGTASLTTPVLTTSSTYTLVSVATASTPSCSQTQTGSAVITVNGSLTAAISGTAAICSGSTAIITFTGTPNTIVTYTVDGGANQTITLNGLGTASLTTPALTVNSTYDLVSVTTTGTPACSQTQTGSAAITVTALPTASISGTTSICSGSTAAITFNGTANATVTYTVNGGTNQTIVLNGLGTATLTTPALTANSSYALVSVTTAGTPACSQTQTGTAAITVIALPTVTILGTTTICSGSTATITFTGTANTTVTYTVNGGANQTISLNGLGTATLTTPALTANSTYALVSVTTTGTPACSQTQTGSAAITVIALPTASISGTATICSGSTATITFNGTPNSTVTYTVNGGANQTIALNGLGTATLTTPALTANTTYALVSVTTTGTTACSQTQTGTAIITINALPTASVAGTTSICSGSTTTITFTGTANATVTYTVNGGTNQTIALNGLGTATLTTPALSANSTYALVSVTATGTPACSQTLTGSAVVTVNALPTATIAGTTAICSGNTATITFTGTPNATVTYTVDGGTNQTILLNAAGTATLTTPTLTANSIYTLVGVAVVGASGCSQTLSGTATITVNTNPIITAPTPYVVCDDNNDGKSCLFNLTTKDIEITSAPNVAAYYGTLTDAQTGSTSVLTSPYCSSTPWTETIYVRVYNPATPACYSITTLQLVVNPTPYATTVITDYTLCDYNNPGDLVEQFTLHSKDLEIANGQANVTITYYPTQADAIAQNAAAALPSLYTSGSQTIWLNIKNNTTGCNSVSSFNLVVNPLPAVYVPPTIIQCSNGASTQALFNLTVNHDAVTGSVSGLTVTYYHSLLDAQNHNNPITTPATYTGTHNEVVYIRVENDNTGCYSTTTQLLQVTQGPLAITPLPLHYCDPNNDGFGVFDLDSVKAQIQGGTVDPLVTIGFYETQTDAIVRATPSLVSPYNNIDPWTQTIYVSVYYTLTGCANYVQLQLIVDPTPEATTPTDFHLCDYTGATGQEPFDLTTKITEILGSINPVGTQVTFYTDNTAAQNGTNVGQITNVTGYLNTSSPQIIYVRVEFTATQCYDIVPLTLVVDGLPLATQPNYPQYSLCDYTGAVGHETFDLNSQVSSILLGQTGMDVLFYPSLAAAQAGLPNTSINALYPSLQYVNVPAYVQTLGIRITNHITGCYSISTMDIRVNPLPSPIPPTSAYTLCDDNQDGIAEFDLTTLTVDILQGANYVIHYYETFTDADSNTNAIELPYLDPTHFNNIFAFSQTLYVRAEDPITHCYTVMPITLAVDPSPVAPFNVPDIELCDQDSNPYNASTIINLTQNTLGILGQQPLAGASYTVEYYTSLALAQAGTAPIIPASSFVGVDGQTIWVRVENNLTGCYNIGTFDLIIHIPLLLTTPPVLNMCDDDAIPNNQHTEFDLTVRDVLINQGTGYTVTYYNSSNVLITDPAHYVNGLPGAVEPITAVVTTPFGCTSSTILDIRVLPVPTPLDPSIATPELTLGVQCENATGSGVAQFDLTTNAGYIMNGDPSVTLHYFPTQADLDNNTNEILNPATAIVGDPAIAGTTVGLVQYVYIAVSSSVFSDYTGRKCYKEVKEGFVVNPLPTVAAIADFQICENDPVTNNGIEVFDLTTQNAALLAGNATTPVSNYTVAFYEDPALTVAITNPTAYSNTSNPQTIYVQITNTTTGCKSDLGSFNLVVNPKPIIATLMPDMSSCDTDGVNDGQMLFTQSGTSPLTSLGGYIEWVLGTTQTAPTYVVEFYDNQTSAEAGISTNALTDLENYQVHTGTYWVRIENLVTGCYQLDSFKVTIEKLARPAITSNTGSNIACVTWGTTTVVNNLILDSGITAPNYTFNWYADGQLVAGENNSTINITNVATSATHVVYTVEAVSVNPPLLDCTSVITPASTFDVIKSGQAANLNYTVTNAFSENQVITVTNDGYGIYQYSMDDGPRQMSPIFEKVSIGTHTIYVWDTLSPDGYSCGVQLIENVETIDYPHYFTPNYDGIHDSWNIHGLVNQPYAKIYVFDRFGKLLKQLSPTTEGWDGTYNGHLMPSDDYWFTVDYQEGTVSKQFKAHFAMKR